MEKSKFMEEAYQKVGSERRADYGPAAQFMERLALKWSGTANCKIDARIASLMMMDLKVLREAIGHKPDNIVDFYGYGLVYEQVLDRNSRILKRCCLHFLQK